VSAADRAIAVRWSAHARVAAAVTLVAVVAGVLLPAPAIATQAWIAAAAVLALGFPHGALDPLVALRRVGRGRHLALVLAAYLGAALAVLALWAVSAEAGLALFLGTSALHFGLGDAPPRSGESGPARAVRVAAHGLGPIVLPSALHPGTAGLVYGWVLGDGGAADGTGASISSWLEAWSLPLVCGWLALAALAVGARPAAARGRAALELGLLALAFLALPPLLSFALYFCVWHSARHLIEVDARLGAAERGRAILCAAAVLGATAALLALLHATATEPRSIEAITRTLFVALAALTPPHMIVTALLRPTTDAVPRQNADSRRGRLEHA